MTQADNVLIGLAGRKGAGKDTVAAVLFERGFVNLKFAGGLKAMLSALLAYQGASADEIDRMIEGDLKEEPTVYLAGRTPRFAMQTLGNEWGRQLIDDSFWVKVTMTKAETTPQAVITDVRYPNECEAVRQRGGRVIRVSSLGGIASKFDDHNSEAHIDQLPVDLDFVNDKRLGIETSQNRFRQMLDGVTNDN